MAPRLTVASAMDGVKGHLNGIPLVPQLYPRQEDMGGGAPPPPKDAGSPKSKSGPSQMGPDTIFGLISLVCVVLVAVLVVVLFMQRRKRQRATRRLAAEQQLQLQQPSQLQQHAAVREETHMAKEDSNGDGEMEKMDDGLRVSARVLG